MFITSCASNIECLNDYYRIEGFKDRVKVWIVGDRTQFKINKDENSKISCSQLNKSLPEERKKLGIKLMSITEYRSNLLGYKFSVEDTSKLEIINVDGMDIKFNVKNDGATNLIWKNGPDEIKTKILIKNNVIYSTEPYVKTQIVKE